MKKRIIFSNMEVDNDYEYEDYEMWISDERANLDVYTDNPLICIADLGLWDGRRSAYKVIESRKIGDILYDNADYLEWYSDGYNIKGTVIHHDGTNHYEYREVRNMDNIHKFLLKLYNNEPVTRQEINYYTKSILPYVKEVYGW